MTTPEPAPLELRRPRDLGALLGDGFRIYFRSFGTFVAIAAAVVVPVELVVSGIGLGQFSAEYDARPPAAELWIPFVASLFVITPLVTAMCIYVLLDVADGRRPAASRAIQRGLDIFAPLLVVMLLFAAAVAVGLFALVLPGIYVLVRFIVAIQAAVVENLRGTDALRRSWELVAGTWWRIFGIVIVTNVVVSGLSALIGLPFLRAAEAADSAAVQLAGAIVSGTLTVPLAALIATLLYFDVRARKGS